MRTKDGQPITVEYTSYGTVKFYITSPSRRILLGEFRTEDEGIEALQPYQGWPDDEFEEAYHGE